MDLGLHGKTAIVAAASRGLGKAVAHAFALEGANVVMFAREPASIEATAREVHSVALDGAQIIGLSADVTRLSDLERSASAAQEERLTNGRLVIVCSPE
jgi:3-oxoacyl-[acyl-carrier protein] reductase